jgi:hypothetical protein
MKKVIDVWGKIHWMINKRTDPHIHNKQQQQQQQQQQQHLYYGKTREREIFL